MNSMKFFFYHHLFLSLLEKKLSTEKLAGKEDGSLHVTSQTRIWEMDRQIPSLLELIFRIKLSKIAKGRDLLSLLEML